MTPLTAKSGKISPWLAALLASLLTLAATFLYLQRQPSPPATAPAAASAAVEDHDDHDTLYTCGMHPWIISKEPGNCPICGMKLTPKEEEGAASSPQSRTIIYWRAPMDPTEIYDQPGKSKMGMDLVPVYEDEVVGGVSVKVDPVTQQNMGIRTQEVKRRPLVKRIRTYGHVTYDETSSSHISPKFSGWVEKIFINYTGQQVQAGDPLFAIYSPELLTAQEEYLAARANLTGMDAHGLLASARRRLHYFDVPEDEIVALEKRGKTTKTIIIRSPFTGVVVTKNIDTGSYIKAGDTVYTIADLTSVWVEAHIFEYELPWIAVGQPATMTLPYLPGRTYTGTIAYVYPYLQRQTRDVVIRLEFPNPDGELKPDMYADILLEKKLAQEGVVIPDEAIIHSGTRDLVFTTRGDGKFTPREVTTGLRLDNNNVEIKQGLVAGDIIVTSGQFLLDSESRLKEAVQKMLEARTAPAKTKKTGAAAQPATTADDDFFNDM